jgi:hypothetical protein
MGESDFQVSSRISRTDGSGDASPAGHRGSTKRYANKNQEEKAA